MNVRRIEGMLRVLERCGVRAAPHVTAESIANALDEEPSYLDLLCLLGSEPAPPRGLWSHDIWHFDTECVAGGGDYVAIAERLRTLAGGDLPLESIADRVDPGGSWLAFTLDGREIRWEVAWEEDWVDPTVLERFARLLASRATGRRFTYCDLGGQDCLIGCAAPAELRRLNDTPGIRFSWLLDAAGEHPGGALGLRGSGTAAGAGPTGAGRPPVSTRALRVEAKRDWFGTGVKFGCGALVGFFFGFLAAFRILPFELKVDFAMPIVLGIIAAYIVGRIALRL